MGEKIFVFGSNEAGIHGAGSAKEAYENHGAGWGVGEGICGSSYAIPTKHHPKSTMSLDEIAACVRRFVAYANSHPDDQFYLVAIGCGLAGLKPSQIAPMFSGSPRNVRMPDEFKPYLDLQWRTR